MHTEKALALSSILIELPPDVEQQRVLALYLTFKPFFRLQINSCREPSRDRRKIASGSANR